MCGQRPAPPPASDAAHSARKRVEHAVDEFGALDAPIPFGELDTLLNHDARWGVSAKELGCAHAKHRSLDDAEAVEPPVGRHFGELLVQLAAVLGDGAHQ